MSFKKNGSTLLLEGIVDVRDALQVKEALMELRSEKQPVIDLGPLESLDLSIVQLLVAFSRSVCGVKILAPEKGEIRELLRLLGVLECQ